MKYKTTDKWLPADGFTLESNALEAVHSDNNTLIIAGPGAGKTELLAQRACYLLETNSCPNPKRILAISFKRDAARNLRERVGKRCDSSLAYRFDSLTFYAFAKGVLDRFHHGLPKEYKINKDYEIIYGNRDILDVYGGMNIDYRLSTNDDDILNKFYNALPLPPDSLDYHVWEHQLKGEKSYLTFMMITRLAELIIKKNPQLKKYLQTTYSHVFLDEFQDTTSLQYQLLNSCFKDSNTVMTAVGDDKQRIMLWAGALSGVFEDFRADYSANQLSLMTNYRSAPNLVYLQNYLITNLLHKEQITQINPLWDKSDGDAYVWIFDNQNTEREYLYGNIQHWIENGVEPREICVLVKQKLQTYAGSLIKYFNERGIPTRDENKYQDLLTDEVVLFIVNLLYLVDDEKKYEAKNYVINFLSHLNSSVFDNEILQEEEKLYGLIDELRNNLNDDFTQFIDTIVDVIIAFVDIDKIKAAHPVYKNETYSNNMLSSISQYLKDEAGTTTDLTAILDAISGVGVIPVMTIHKSKGLEYHTVIFVGLEDDAFWSYARQSDEDKCAFFVALSRAKERVVFTFSRNRNGKPQRSRVINELFKSLGDSGRVQIQEVKQ